MEKIKFRKIPSKFPYPRKIVAFGHFEKFIVPTTFKNATVGHYVYFLTKTTNFRLSFLSFMCQFT